MHKYNDATVCTIYYNLRSTNENKGISLALYATMCRLQYNIYKASSIGWLDNIKKQRDYWTMANILAKYTQNNPLSVNQLNKS